MRRLGLLIGVACVTCVTTIALTHAAARAEDAPQAKAHAYALLVSSGQGGAGQNQLRYAEQDALRVGEVLTSLAGYQPDDVQRLVQPSAEDLRAALEQLRARLALDAAAGEQSVVFLYYSGHARADALNLGAESMPLTELRERITALPATLSIVVLDACQSGAFSRVKGASAAADFSYNSVQRLNVEGVAVMASSSAVELSQESDELKSSYSPTICWSHCAARATRIATVASRSPKPIAMPTITRSRPPH